MAISLPTVRRKAIGPLGMDGPPETITAWPATSLAGWVASRRQSVVACTRERVIGLSQRRPLRIPNRRRTSHTNLSPLHTATPNRVAHSPLARRQRRHPGLHLDEHDSTHLTLVQAVEHHEVDRLPEELRILGVEVKLGQIRHELLEDLSPRHRPALEN